MNLEMIEQNISQWTNVEIKYATNFIADILNPSLAQIKHAVDIGVPFQLRYTASEEIKEFEVYNLPKPKAYYRDVSYCYDFNNGDFNLNKYLQSTNQIYKDKDLKLLNEHGNISIEFIRDLINDQSNRISKIEFVTLHEYIEIVNDINEDFDECDDIEFHGCSSYFDDIAEFDFYIDHKIPLVIEIFYEHYGTSIAPEYVNIRYSESGEQQLFISDDTFEGESFLNDFENEQIKVMKLMGKI